ncbi:MAG TPA: hypothetical protein VLA52_08055 [Thermohalobaculum sp.]|nr:hypothetical protein [Thermohalobaculum sp.]
MFHVTRILPVDTARAEEPEPSEIPKEDCLETAALWALRRRANLPYLPPQRLPAIARVA